MNGLRGSRGVTNAAFQWSHELAKLPSHGVTWAWSGCVGSESWKCAYAAAYKMMQAGYILKHSEGEYETTQDLEEYLREHDYQLESWRSALNEFEEGQIISDKHGRVGRWVEGGVECRECGDVFDRVCELCSHFAACHASQAGSQSCVTEGSQARLDEFERVGKSLQKGASEQTVLIC